MATANRPNDKRHITNLGRKSRSEGRVRIIASTVVKSDARVNGSSSRRTAVSVAVTVATKDALKPEMSTSY